MSNLILVAIVGGLDLQKGKGHKYKSKVPTNRRTKTGKTVYRYVYHHPTKGLVHKDSVQLGSKFHHGVGEHHGHYEITNVHEDGTFTIVHDETGDRKTITHAQLEDLIHGDHHHFDTDETSVKQKTKHALESYKQALETGTEKQQKRLRDRFIKFTTAYPHHTADLVADFVKIDPASKAKLSSIQEGGVSTFTAVSKIYTKGRGDQKKRYGGQKQRIQLEHITYGQAVNRSKAQIERMDANAIINEMKNKANVDIDTARDAFDEIYSSLFSETGSQRASSSEALSIGGSKVTGFAESVSEKSKGTLYISGIVKKENIQEIDAGLGHGPPTKSRDKTRAKNVLRSKLAVGRWRTYRVHPEGLEQLEHRTTEPKATTQKKKEGNKEKGSKE